jgi:hypothetical protein
LQNVLFAASVKCTTFFRCTCSFPCAQLPVKHHTPDVLNPFLKQVKSQLVALRELKCNRCCGDSLIQLATCFFQNS